ncbi:bifunctional acetate--CoA ligase family protein/GNAT family N-acetyltransferase [Cellulomonas carbonis]|uniref:GCN5 family acetyltransferase n=1 Tax=Cellulomonas carbonis T26 TaxID=947969 RepID=A0A0A0BZH6_9CELL|nr:GNAT family N-acetyltransferase [Cellulomonas carbonis]KGM12584.1 GCN5 family acetyltransferase [Cellulomonas carbonis T26]GGB93257.1 GNAT family N-acetyltransferase [Cellulomonas carbonis]
MTDDDAADGAGPAYPLHWEADVVLRDGGTAHVRPIRPDDASALQAFHVAQSERSTYFRFFAPLERLPESDLRRFTHVDHRDRVALVAVADEAEGERIIAVGRYDRVEEGTAEVAFNVADDHHGRGLGSVLLEHLAAAARERGVTRFTADVLPHNAAMIAVFREAGYAVSQRMDDGILTVRLDLDPTVRSLAVMADREHAAEARSVSGLLTPRSVLVVVAAEEDAAGERLLASAVLRHLVADRPGTEPELHVVGPADDVPGVARHADLADVPGPVDLVVLAVPAGTSGAVVRRCARLRPRAVLVLSEGFAEVGPEGLARQRDLLRGAHSGGMRVLGPASYGFFRQGGPDTPTVNASLAAELPSPGRLGLFCQSAPLAVGLLASARRRRLGLSTFVSSGNRADVSGNDAMQFWTEDQQTDVVAMYLESIGNPRKFSRVARRLAAVKPVVVLTAGRSGHVDPAGHAVRSTRVPRQALDQVLRQAGVVRVDSQHQLLDVAMLLAHQPLPAGRRVAVLAGSEPLAALAAEAASSAGLVVVSRWTLSGGAGATVGPDQVEDEVAAAYAAPDVDAVVVAHVPTVGSPDPAVARAVAAAAAGTGRPTVACILGLTGVTEELTAPAPVPGGEGRTTGSRTVPAYATPEDAVVALAAAARYGAWRNADHGRPVEVPDADRPRARRLVEAALAGRGDELVDLTQDAAADLLSCYGLRLWPTVVARTPEEAVAAGDALGWPVALKSAAGHLRHRIDLGGVRLDLAGPAAVVEAMEHMRAHLEPLGAADVPFEVQRMAPGGAACVVRSAEDPRFGPVVSFGMAGDAVDLLGDTSHGIPPLTDVDVRDMVRSVRAAPRLFGYRGLPALDVAALEDVLARVSVLADDVPELHALELHPVVVAEEGAAVLGARVRLGATGRADSGRRTLPG